MRKFAALMPLLAFVSGCPVWQSQDVPVPATYEKEKTTFTNYWLYVPADYSDEKEWPLVVTLHGTIPYDTCKRQIDEWKKLAEDKQFIVVAPRLHSTQGILPVIPKHWFEDLQRDEEAILAVIDEMCKTYRIAEDCIMLHAFSAGGYPLYYTGLHNPKRFNIIVARGCNCRNELLEQIEIADEARKLPIMILVGKDDNILIQKQCWMAFRFLREHRCLGAKRKEFRGGHLRRPDLAYKYWHEHWPQRLKQRTAAPR
ncbi:MAG: hypothetical protein ACYTF6_10315 [Planctomycetota bacterium]